MILKSIRSLIQRYPVIIYCVLTFSITWGLKYWYSLVRTDNYIPPFNFSLIAQFGPSISAVILIAFSEGYPGIRRIGKSIRSIPANPKWMLMAFIFEPVIFLSITVFYWLRYQDLTIDGSYTWISAILSYFMTFFIGLFRWGLSEEIGWHGWMLPKLQSRMSPFMATLILSIVITLWHIHPNTFPEIAAPQEGTYILGYIPEAVERWIISFPICLVTTYIFNKTMGSLLVMMIYHSASNTSYFWVAEVFGIEETDFFKTSFLVAVLVIGCVFSLLVLKQKDKVTS